MPSRPANIVLEQAAAALRARRVEDAERLARDVLKADRGNIAAAEILGRALLIQNRAVDAIDLLRKAALRGNDPGIETLLARALAAAGQANEAADQLVRTIARQPPFLPAYLERAELYGKEGRIDQSIAVLEAGLARAPNAIDLKLALGQLHLKQGDRATARRLLAEVHAAAPERHDALIALAKAATLDGDHAAAAAFYRNALARNPRDAVTRVNLGKCQLEMGDRAAGEATLRAAIRDDASVSSLALAALAGTSHGRFFLKPSDATKFLTTEEA